MKRLKSVLKNEYKYLLRQQVLQESLRDQCFADGYLSRKKIAAKDRIYFQFLDQGKLRSVYLSEEEAERVRIKLEQKRRAEDTLSEIRADISDICSLISTEELKDCREMICRTAAPVLPEPQMKSAVGLSPDFHLLYFWEPLCVDRERHLWKYSLLFRWKRRQRTVDCGLLNEEIWHNVKVLQAYAGWLVDEYVRNQELLAAAEKLTDGILGK